MAVDDWLGPLADPAAAVVDDLVARRAVERLWDFDHTLWQDDPSEVADRLGWLRSPADLRDRSGTVDGFVDGVRADGLTDAVVMGMGGSSLFPEVAGAVLGGRGLRLHVLDTTDPAAIRRVRNGLDLERTLFIAASKSGTTIETTSQLAYFWQEVGDPSRFVVITDPGSALVDLARERGFRAIFENRPDIGGRFSALSYFGIIPAALVTPEWERLLIRAGEAALELGPGVPAATNEAVRLAAAMAAGARHGRDKLTLILAPEIAPFGAWVEQLVAESTGKLGTGLLPVVDEPIRAPETYADDRLFVAILAPPEPVILPAPDAPMLSSDVFPAHRRDLGALARAGHPVVELGIGDVYDLGAQVLLWEMATALAGAALGINPFDQPDVAAAKANTARVLESGGAAAPTASSDQSPDHTLDGLLDGLTPPGYLAICAYVDPGGELVPRLERARDRLSERLGVAVTLGIGPRYLHSTGQLHKGGPPNGRFVVVVGDSGVDLDVPNRAFTFGQLLRAQATGDVITLRERGLRAALVDIADLLAAAGT